MSFLNKVYKYESHENFDEWLKAVGLPEDKVAAVLNDKPSTKVVKDGDSYISTYTTSKGEKATTFKSGVEFDDTIGDENIPIKTTITVDGNVVTQVFSSAMGSATFKKIFNGDELVVEITGGKYDGVVKRFYKA